MANHGGARSGAGRKRGQVSQAKRDLAEMAKDHAEMALTTLAMIARDGESEAARVSAANAILDRAYGKPMQGVLHSGPNGGPIQHAVNVKELTDDELARIALGGGNRAAAPEEGA